MAFELGERDRVILQAVVTDYIRTAEPVGSRALSKRYDLELSPATIRNVMADLEDLGFLKQPHTSAGRIPTESGLRYYVDSILEVREIGSQQQTAIQRGLTGVIPELEQLVRNSSKVLSSVSKQIGIVVAPKFSQLVLKHLQFIRLNRKSVLVILVGTSGMIQNRIIEIDEGLAQDDLDRFNRYLVDILGGLSISEIKVRIVEEMRQEKNQFDEMLSRALALSHKVFESSEDEDDVYVEGRMNLLEYPEFSDVEAMKSIFTAFEDKNILVRLLDKTLHASGVQIFIGSENEMTEMKDCTLIASRYSRGSRALGTLGVIGPTRLNYSKVIPVVDYTAKLLSQILESDI